VLISGEGFLVQESLNSEVRLARMMRMDGINGGALGNPGEAEFHSGNRRWLFFSGRLRFSIA